MSSNFLSWVPEFGSVHVCYPRWSGHWGVGVRDAPVTAMEGVRNPEQFAAWQRAWKLKERVFAFTAAAPAVLDRKFCEDIRKAARSAPDNISEGFFRFNPTDFANFVRVARGSLGEVRNQLKHAESHKYLTDSEVDEIFRLCGRAIRAATGLRLYLLSVPRNFDPRNRKRNASAGRHFSLLLRTKTLNHCHWSPPEPGTRNLIEIGQEPPRRPLVTQAILPRAYANLSASFQASGGLRDVLGS